MSELTRCDWCQGNELYLAYHDHEWGVPVHDDRIHFEFMVLESAQAGLSWLTILKRRENYRLVYDNFDPEIVAAYDPIKIESLVNDPRIIRNRKKIESSVNNAKCFLKIREEYGSFDSYIWGFTGGKTIRNNFSSIKELPASTPLSDRIAKDLRDRGFRFLGSTIIYAHLQSVGIINDHLVSCFRYHEAGR